MKNLKYAEILKRNQELKKNKYELTVPVGILSNITVNQLKEICEYGLAEKGIGTEITIGNYDNIVQDSNDFVENRIVIVLWELSNLIEGLHYKIEIMDESKIEEIIEKVKSELSIVFKNLKNVPLLIMPLFSSRIFSRAWSGAKLTRLEEALNDHLTKVAPGNVKLIDLDCIFSDISVPKSISWRFYVAYKNLYTTDFFKAFFECIRPIVLATLGKARKVLIFDCDNTLWKGILGEDGRDGIQMSPNTAEGHPYHEVQCLARALAQQGTILGLCSKNNPEEVEDILKNHPDMVLRDDCFVIKKVNWVDKISNLKEIAQELNLGLDSLVFVDDSAFEIGLVQKFLPEIETLQVPEKTFDYPSLFRDKISNFYNLSRTAEDAKKTSMYKQQVLREKAKGQFDDLESYLRSLDLAVAVSVNDRKQISRIAQLTQKTNQFNLTTKRYTETEISKLMYGKSDYIYGFSVRDKIGSSGLTGLLIVKVDEASMTSCIDSFLMSCRIIGRNIEHKMFEAVSDELTKMGVKKISGRFIKTPKNLQVADLYDRLGFTLTFDGENKKDYELILPFVGKRKIDYIEVEHGS